MMVRGSGWSPRVASRLPLDMVRLTAFCDRWQIAGLELFGSVLLEDFRAESDIDMLVSFRPGVRWGLLDHAAMEEELSRLFRRRVDLLTRRSVERSPETHRRSSILNSAVPLLTLADSAILADA